MSSQQEIVYRESDNKATIDSRHLESVETLLKKCKVDTTVWEVQRFVINKWDVTSFKHNPNGTKRENYQVKVWLKKKTDIKDVKSFREELIDELKTKAHKFKRRKYRPVKTGHLLEINLFDVHFGKLGWEEETGDGYNIEIARSRFLNAIHDLLGRSRLFGIDRIVFPVGNDFFNSDSAYPYPATTRGTAQQDCTRWQEMFREGRKLIVEAIDYCSQYAPVDVLIIPGNHDFQTSFYLGDVLEVQYSKNPNVTVNNSPTPRKYYKYHNSLIGFCHGNHKNETLNRLVMIMPQEAPEDWWGSTKFREWHLGDIHHRKKIEFNVEKDFQGIVVRYMKSLSGTDAYHKQKGYVGSVKGGEAFLHHKEYGIVANFSYNIPIV